MHLCKRGKYQNAMTKLSFFFTDIALEELRSEVAALKAQIDGVPSVGAVDAASASCNAEKVHIHFDHEDAEEEHSSPDDTHVHINLKIDPPMGMMRGMMGNMMGGQYAPGIVHVELVENCWAELIDHVYQYTAYWSKSKF